MQKKLKSTRRLQEGGTSAPTRTASAWRLLRLAPSASPQRPSRPSWKFLCTLGLCFLRRKQLGEQEAPETPPPRHAAALPRVAQLLSGAHRTPVPFEIKAILFLGGHRSNSDSSSAVNGNATTNPMKYGDGPPAQPGRSRRRPRALRR